MRLPLALLTLLLLCGGAVAQGQGQAQAQAMPGMNHGGGGAGGSTAGSAAAAALADSMRTMDEGMAKATMTGDTDADFVRMMIAHHKGAVAMAKVELQYGRDEGLKALAGNIVAAQEKEIAEMQAWLDAHKGR